MDTATKQVIRNVRNFVNHRFREKAILEEDRLGSEGRRESMLQLSRTASSVWALPSVRRTSISLNESWFRAHVKHAYRSVNDNYV